MTTDEEKKEKRVVYLQKWREENREKCKEYEKTAKKYSEDNQERINELSKKYYEEHKEEIRIKKGRKITCECGCVVSYNGLAIHRRTKKHTFKLIPTLLD